MMATQDKKYVLFRLSKELKVSNGQNCHGRRSRDGRLPDLS